MHNLSPIAYGGEQSAGFQVRKAVSFIVPAFNEQISIADTIREIEIAARGLEIYQIVIVNDCSTDNTAEIADALARKDNRIFAIHNKRNMGLGAAYKAGIAQATMPYVIMIPGDNNHPAQGIVPILERLGQADIIIPYVTNPEVRPLHRRIISSAFRCLLNFLFRLKVPYYNGLVLHRLALLKTIPIETDGFAYQAEVLIKLRKRGASSITVPVEISRDHRRSRAFRFKNIRMVVATICRLLRT